MTDDWDDEKETRCWVTLRVAVSVYGEEPNDENIRDALVATVEQDALHRDHIDWGVEGNEPNEQTPPLPGSMGELLALPLDEAVAALRALQQDQPQGDRDSREGGQEAQLLSDNELARIESEYDPSGVLHHDVTRLLGHARALADRQAKLAADIRNAMQGASTFVELASQSLLREDGGIDFDVMKREAEEALKQIEKLLGPVQGIPDRG